MEKTGFVRTPEAELVELVGHLEGLAEELGMVEAVVRARRVRRLLEVLRDSGREGDVDRPSRGVGRRPAR